MDEMLQTGKLRLSSSLIQILVVLAVALPYFINLGGSALWDSNETFYAETPREMLQSGNYLAPMFNYVPRPQKPPLTYWWVLLGYLAVGINEVGVRLPVAVAVLGTLFFTFGIARRLFSTRVALLSVAILGTTLRLFILARKLPIDILLVLCLTATAYFFVRAVQKPSRFNWLMIYFCAGLGLLTKGPVAWAIPGLSFFLWLLWSRRFRIGSVYPISGLVTLIAVSAPWYILTYFQSGWLYISDFFLQDNFARFATEIKGPVRGPFYYFSVFAGDFFPWSILTLGAVIYLWCERRKLRAQYDLVYGFPLIWSFVTFALFSISKNKQEYYIAPMYPLVSVLLAGVLDTTLSGRDRVHALLRSCWKWLVLTVSAVFLAVAFLSPFIMPAFVPDGPIVLHYAPALVFLIFAGMLAGFSLRGELWRCVLAIAASVCLGFILAGAVYLPAFERLRPVKEICRTILAQAKPGDEFGYFRAAVPSMIYYLRRPIFSISNPPTMAEKLQGQTRVFCVLGDRDYHYFKEQCGVELFVLNRYQQLPTQLRIMLGNESPTGEGDALLLVSNRPVLAATH